MFKKWDAEFLKKNWCKTSLPPLNPKVPFLQKAFSMIHDLNNVR